MGATLQPHTLTPGRPDQRVEPIVVVLVHGIRTRAWWQSVLRERLENSGTLPEGSRVISARYGYFDTLRLLIPRWSRRGAMDAVEEQLRAAFKDRPNARKVVIAHSFGTYLMAQLLLARADVSLDVLIMCGSIVPIDFPWKYVAERVPLIVNECGAMDVWPLLAKSITWGYGASGVYGFGGAFVRDRFHWTRHSEYLKTSFLEQQWLDVILYGTVKPSTWNPEQRKPPWWVEFLDKLLIRWLIVAALIVLSVNRLAPFVENLMASTGGVVIEGVVKDSLTGAVISGVNVTVEDTRDHPPPTDSDGRFSLTSSELRRGETYHLYVDREGYKSKDISMERVGAVEHREVLLVPVDVRTHSEATASAPGGR